MRSGIASSGNFALTRPGVFFVLWGLGVSGFPPTFGVAILSPNFEAGDCLTCYNKLLETIILVTSFLNGNLVNIQYRPYKDVKKLYIP